MIKLNEFTTVDWYGYAGATRFDDGALPMISYVPFTGEKGEEATLILDATGIEVTIGDGSDESPERRWTLDLETQPRALIELIARNLPLPLTPEILTAFGFKESK